MGEQNQADKLRQIAKWVNRQNEEFNDNWTSVKSIEQVYDVAMRYGYEFVDDLQTEILQDKHSDATIVAKAVNRAFGFAYYCL